MQGNERKWKAMEGNERSLWDLVAASGALGVIFPGEGQITATARVPKIRGVTPPILGKSLWGLGYERK